jgi:hypothetical protein
VTAALLVQAGGTGVDDEGLALNLITLALRNLRRRATRTIIVSLSVGLAVHNGPTNVELDLYVGLFLPDNQIAFFAGSGPAGLRLPPAAPTPMQRLSQGSSVTLPRFLEVALPPGVPSGTYQFFAALVKPGALSDGFVDGSELAGFDLEEFTIAP